MGGYSGAAGMTQAFAAGYFLWDCVACTLYFESQGIGALMHGVAALVITVMGFVRVSSEFLLVEMEGVFGEECECACERANESLEAVCQLLRFGVHTV